LKSYIAGLSLSVAMLPALCAGSGTFRQVVAPGVPVDNVNTFPNLATALEADGLVVGARIQINPGAVPGTLTAAALNKALSMAINGFEVAGAAGTDPVEMEPIKVSENLVVTGASVYFTGVNIHVESSSGINIIGPGFRLGNSELSSDGSPDGMLILNGTGAILYNNRYRSVGGTQIKVQFLASNSYIVDSEFLSMGDATNIAYQSVALVNRNDQISDNRFVGGLGATSPVQLMIAGGNSAITVRDNVFTDPDTGLGAIQLSGGGEIRITRNQFSFGSTPSSGLIQVLGSGTGFPTEVGIDGNDLNLVTSGIGLEIQTSMMGSVSAIVEGNRFRGGAGVTLQNNGGSLANIDFGGGNQGSQGCNIFRSYTGIATAGTGSFIGLSGTGSVSAGNNAFAGDPEISIMDFNDENSRPDILPTDPLTGNKAYVAGMFTLFSMEAVNVHSLEVAGADVAALDAGKPASVFAKKVIRSERSLTPLVHNAYHRMLRRRPVGDEYSKGVLFMTKRSEEDFQTSLLTSNEARNLYASTTSFTHKAFNTLLGRVPTEDEVTTFSAMAAKSRLKGVQTLLKSPEYTTRRVHAAYQYLLRRDATADEIKKYKTQDRLRLLTTIASSPEFITGG